MLRQWDIGCTCQREDGRYRRVLRFHVHDLIIQSGRPASPSRKVWLSASSSARRAVQFGYSSGAQNFLRRDLRALLFSTSGSAMRYSSVTVRSADFLRRDLRALLLFQHLDLLSHPPPHPNPRPHLNPNPNPHPRPHHHPNPAPHLNPNPNRNPNPNPSPVRRVQGPEGLPRTERVL